MHFKRGADGGRTVIHDLHPHASGERQIQWDADPIVPNGEGDAFGTALQSNQYAARLAMLPGVIQGFLGDPKEVGGDGRTFDLHRLSATEGAAHLEEIGGRFCILRERFHQAIALGFNRVQAVGEIARFKDARVEQLANLFCMVCCRVSSGDKLAVEQACHHRRSRKVLAESVVQLLADELLVTLTDP